MNALATAEAVSGDRERGLKILKEELLEDRPRRITISLDASRAVSGPANAALRAAALLAVKLGAFHEHKEAPAALQDLLKVAGAA